jgi:hypothetical protein
LELFVVVVVAVGLFFCCGAGSFSALFSGLWGLVFQCVFGVVIFVCRAAQSHMINDATTPPGTADKFKNRANPELS